MSLAAYWHGAFNPRRRSGRRAGDHHYPVVDWHSPRVFALVLTILVLCTADAVLTVILMSHGATELNPVMALFLPHSLPWFAALKLALTSAGICVLVVCSRMRVFRAIPGEWLLYAVLIGYVVLITYQLRLLDLAQLPST